MARRVLYVRYCVTVFQASILRQRYDLRYRAPRSARRWSYISAVARSICSARKHCRIARRIFHPPLGLLYVSIVSFSSAADWLVDIWKCCASRTLLGARYFDTDVSRRVKLRTGIQLAIGVTTGCTTGCNIDRL